MDTPEQAQMRRHLAEMTHAARLVGKDVSIWAKNIDHEITKLGTKSGRDLADGAAAVRDEIFDLARSLDAGFVRLPGQMKDGAVAAGSAIASGTVRVAGATRDAFEAGATRAREGTKNALATAAGVKKKPMRQWHAPANDADSDPNH